MSLLAELHTELHNAGLGPQAAIVSNQTRSGCTLDTRSQLRGVVSVPEWLPQSLSHKPSLYSTESDTSPGGTILLP